MMLWSDPPDEPDKEIRAAQTKLQRLYWVLPLVVAAVMLLLHTSNV